MTYSVRISCYDCTGSDIYGCFEGGTEFIDASFETIGAASAAGYAATEDCGPWYFEILDVSGKVVPAQ